MGAFIPFVNNMLQLYSQFLQAPRIEGDEQPPVNMFLLSQGISRNPGLLQAFINFEADFTELVNYTREHQQYPENYDETQVHFPANWPEELKDADMWCDLINAQIITMMITVVIGQEM